MRYVAAYCLASFAGGEPTVKDIEKILGSVGLDCEAENAKKVVDELKGKKLDDVISKGKEQLSSVPTAGPSAGASSGGAPAAAAAAEAAAPKKEEKKEEPEEESDDDMGFGLFD